MYGFYSNSHSYNRHRMSPCVDVQILFHSGKRIKGFVHMRQIMPENIGKLTNLNIKVMNLTFHWIQYFVLITYVRSEMLGVQLKWAHCKLKRVKVSYTGGAVFKVKLGCPILQVWKPISRTQSKPVVYIPFNSSLIKPFCSTNPIKNVLLRTWRHKQCTVSIHYSLSNISSRTSCPQM